MPRKSDVAGGLSLWFQRLGAAGLLAGQTFLHILNGKIQQIDALYILKTDPIDYLVIPRVIACSLMLPLLTIISLVTGLLGGLFISDSLYGISYSLFLQSAQNFMETWDLISSMLKSLIFGVLIAIIGCSWGLTTTGGAKGVGQSTTTAVVTSLLAIFVANFFLSWLMFQGTGNAEIG